MTLAIISLNHCNIEIVGANTSIDHGGPTPNQKFEFEPAFSISKNLRKGKNVKSCCVHLQIRFSPARSLSTPTLEDALREKPMAAPSYIYIVWENTCYR